MDCYFLSKTNLFPGTSEQDIDTMLKCLQTELRRYGKGEVVLRAGDQTRRMGLVLSGSVQIENDDVWGNKSLLDRVGDGQVFAETYACMPGETLMVSVAAAEAAEILFLDVERVLKTCPDACSYHSRLIRNLLMISAQKNLNLSRRIFHTSSKTIRGRLLSYLSYEASRAGSCEFTIPFNRQQLADYLSVDRSAMSAEIGRMQREGLLRSEKNYFCLYRG